MTAVALPFSTCSVLIQNFEVKFYHFWLQRILIVFRMHHRTPAYLLDMSELENVFEIVFPKGFVCFFLYYGVVDQMLHITGMLPPWAQLILTST